MEQQSPLAQSKKGLNLLHYGSLLLPSDEYVTIVRNFPVNNCIPEWGLEGEFYATFGMYSEGKKLGEFHTDSITESGYIECCFDDLLGFGNAPHTGLIITELWHEPKIPVELYFSHIHRKTGAYIAYPSLVYMGDQLYPSAHTDQLENSLFWPGIPFNDGATFELSVLNPFKVSFSFQVSLFLPSGERRQTEVLRARPLSVKTLKIEEMFPNEVSELSKVGGLGSLCISAQYKVLSYGIIKDRQTGIITTADHLHQYTMI